MNTRQGIEFRDAQVYIIDRGKTENENSGLNVTLSQTYFVLRVSLVAACSRPHGKRFERVIMADTTSSLPLRRSSRVNIGCPVRISGVLIDDAPFAEVTRIITVSKYGAKLKTRIPLQVGMQVKVKPLLGRKSAVFRVAWVGRDASPHAGEVGVESAEGIASILGISFPDAPGPGRHADQSGKSR
jgi:hypothetical protein